jgi:lipoprotein-releasing system permease protein
MPRRWFPPFSLFLALRFLRPKRNFVSLITILSIIGVALGVQVLVFVVAIMTGYDVRMRQTVLGFEPHLDLQQPRPIENWPELLELVRKNPEVTDAAPFTRGQLVLDVHRQLRAVRVQGLEPQPGPILDRLKRLVREGEGTFDLSGDTVVVGRALARKLGIKVGDTVILHSLANGRQMLEAQREGRQPEDLIVPAELTVSGIFDSGRYSYDVQTIFIPLQTGQTLYSLQGAVHGLIAQVRNPYEAGLVRDQLRLAIPPPLEIYSWMDRNRAKFEFIASNRLLIYFLMFMIVIAAGFSIMNTMITVTTQKRREIGIVKAVGARMDQIVHVFLGQGLAVGAIGTALGLLIGILLLAFRQPLRESLAQFTQREIFSAEVYDFYDLPAHLAATDLVVICGGAFFACAFSSLLPAYLAARLDAARALRNESSV